MHVAVAGCSAGPAVDVIVAAADVHPRHADYYTGVLVVIGAARLAAGQNWLDSEYWCRHATAAAVGLPGRGGGIGCW